MRTDTRPLGLPTYDDAGVGYHDPKVENLNNALLGVHRGLSQTVPTTNYQGVAIYCDWETSDAEWNHFRQHFLKPTYSIWFTRSDVLPARASQICCDLLMTVSARRMSSDDTIP